MDALCHRCHAPLPNLGTGDRASDDDALLFCPRCGAPQLLLEEHLRIPAAVPGTTGALPPPRPAGARPPAAGPGQVDWHAAIAAMGLVAAVDAVLVLIGLRSDAISFLSVLWTLGAAVMALGLYARRRPAAWMDARIGLRVGVATGLLVVAAIAFALAVTGTALRFGSHGLANFDRDMAQLFAQFHTMMTEKMRDQNQPPEVQQHMLALMESPQGRAGLILSYLALAGGMVVLVSAGCGAFAGMLRASQRPRHGLRRGD